MKNKKQYTIPVFVPHLGCGFDCVFCNQDRITGVSTNVTSKDVRNKIEEYLGYFTEDHYIEVGFFGGSFTGIDIKRQRELLSVAREYKESGKIDGIRLSTRPDFIDRERLEFLKEFKVDTIELGVQSLEEEVLNRSGRGHSSKVVYEAVDLIKEYKFNLGLQMMVGLPGDNFEKSFFTAKEFVKLSPDCIRVYPTLVIKDTKLEEDYKKGRYKALDLKESIDIVTPILMLFELNNMNVIRLGLQVTENIQKGKDIVAGPFHPSYKQLIESNIYKIILDRELEKNKNSFKTLKIKTNEKNISNIIGNKKENLNYFKEKYNLLDFIVKKDKKVQDKNIIIYIDDEEIYLDYLKHINNYMEGEVVNAT